MSKYKGRKYTMEFIAPEDKVNWELAEHQLFKLANDVEKVCGIPVTIKLTNLNTSASEAILRWGRIIKDWKGGNPL